MQETFQKIEKEIIYLGPSYFRKINFVGDVFYTLLKLQTDTDFIQK